MLTPLLSGANYLDIPITSIRAKEYLRPTVLDKSGGRTAGYFPDYSVWAKAMPVMIVEAKSPEVAAEEGYREASLYARHLNQKYRSGLNPCHFIVSCNGTRVLAGTWDSEPIIDVAISDLQIGSSILARLREFCGNNVLVEHAAKYAAAMRPVRSTLPYNRAGGQALLNSKKAFNTFAAELAPVLRRYFTSSSQNADRDIYERGYVATDDITTYDQILESLLKDRIVARRGNLMQDLEPSRSSEPRLTAAIDEFKSQIGEGQLQLITGGVGTGKSLFIRRYKELLQPKEYISFTHWAFIDFNSAPASLDHAEEWLCEKFVESFQRENTEFDVYAGENLPRVFSRDLQKRRGIYDELRKVSEDDARRQRAADLQSWQDDPKRLAFGICQHFLGQRREVVSVVMDNVDRLSLENQLAAFQLSLWFMDQSNAFVILQMRDETYERFKDRPPLDTFRSGVTFHITPPRFLDVVKRRLELCLEYLTANVEEKLEYTLSNGAKIVYPRTMLGEFLKGIYLELFVNKHNVSRVLQGIAGRDVRRALEMFVSILNSGHLSAEAITSHAKGAGEISVPEYTILKILMRTEYRFFSENSGFVSNIFHFDDEWERPNNFIIPDILFWLYDNRKRRGDIGLEGYFSVGSIADVMQLRGYIRDDIIAACSWLLRKELIEADHMNRTGLSGDDSVKVTASGFIHLRILCQRLEYLFGVLSVTPIFDSGVAIKIADYLNRENQYDRISGHQMAECVEEFLRYLKYNYSLLQAAYPEFGGERTGSTFILQQVEDALDHFRRPATSSSRQLNMLDM
ncbi:hypothetical protein [Methylocystis hirsuta]|nr:hypothetical protein [Methylocystis hirsuta]